MIKLLGKIAFKPGFVKQSEFFLWQKVTEIFRRSRISQLRIYPQGYGFLFHRAERQFFLNDDRSGFMPAFYPPEKIAAVP